MKQGDKVEYWPNPLNKEDEDVRTEVNPRGPIPAKILSTHGSSKADLQVIPDGKAKVLKLNVPLAKQAGCSSTFTKLAK